MPMLEWVCTHEDAPRDLVDGAAPSCSSQREDAYQCGLAGRRFTHKPVFVLKGEPAKQPRQWWKIW
jgi:hypothetical protein